MVDRGRVYRCTKCNRVLAIGVIIAGTVEVNCKCGHVALLCYHTNTPFIRHRDRVVALSKTTT